MTHQPRASFKSPRFAQPPTFMRLPHVEDPHGLDVAIVGVPFDGGTSSRPGARLGPREIRSQSSLIRTYSYFQKVAPFDRLNVADVGDVDAPPVSIEKCYAAVEERIGAIADAGATPLVVGGDHSISLPVSAGAREAARSARARPVRRAHRYLGRVLRRQVLAWTPFRRAIEEGAIDGRRFIQIGIRGPLYGEEDFEFHAEHGITVIDIEHAAARGVDWIIEQIHDVATGPAYMTFDIDAVDPAFAPGTGTPEVGGLQPRGAAARPRPCRASAGRRRRRGSVPAVRRPRTDYVCSRGEPDVRVPVRSGEAPHDRGAPDAHGRLARGIRIAASTRPPAASTWCCAEWRRCRLSASR